MREWRSRQSDLFKTTTVPIELSELQRGKALELLKALLTEAIAANVEDGAVQEQREVGNDQDHD